MDVEEAKAILGGVGWSTRELSEWSDADLIRFAEEEAE